MTRSGRPGKIARQVGKDGPALTAHNAAGRSRFRFSTFFGPEWRAFFSSGPLCDAHPGPRWLFEIERQFAAGPMAARDGE